MGEKGVKKQQKLWVNTKKLRKRNISCMDEMMGLLACFKRCNFEDDRKCAGEKKKLDDCLIFAANQPKDANTINFHLQRLNNASKR